MTVSAHAGGRGAEQSTAGPNADVRGGCDLRWCIVCVRLRVCVRVCALSVGEGVAEPARQREVTHRSRCRRASSRRSTCRRRTRRCSPRSGRAPTEPTAPCRTECPCCCPVRRPDRRCRTLGRGRPRRRTRRTRSRACCAPRGMTAERREEVHATTHRAPSQAFFGSADFARSSPAETISGCSCRCSSVA